MTTRHPRGPRHSRPRDRGRPIDITSALGASPSRWVKVTCPACGVVRVLAGHVVVRNCIDDQSWSYRARCSRCDTTFVGTTPESLALPAVAAGLAVELWRLPRPSARCAGSTLETVDALELHLALLEPDWFEEWMRVEPLGDR